MITGLNHITLAVKDSEKSFAFYRDILGFMPLCKWEGSAYFLDPNDHKLEIHVGDWKARIQAKRDNFGKYVQANPVYISFFCLTEIETAAHLKVLYVLL